ncbi:hypothetical protein Trydic_g21576 [Trypoxylus dichotomus]
MDNTYFNAVWYADYLLRLLHSFNQLAKQLNMIINTDKSKCLVISKRPVRCKLEVDERMIEQVNHSKYLRADITSSGDLDSETREQTVKASRIEEQIP